MIERVRHAMKSAFLILTALLLAAQSAPPPVSAPEDPIAQAFRQLDEGRYLAAIDGLREAARSEPPGSPLRQLWEQMQPMIGGLVDPAALPSPAAEVDLATAARLGEAAHKDAISQIVQGARQTNIVIMNEAHHSPRDRAFALQVARALRPLGYSVLAAEAFGNSADVSEAEASMRKIASDGYVRRSSGPYLADPVFADFIRQAVAIGYRPVSYEATGMRPVPAADRIPVREQAQAQNLMQRIFARDPNAKVLIYVGFRHVTEAPIGSPPRRGWLAG